MRFWAILFAFYLSVLAVKPCTDTHSDRTGIPREDSGHGRHDHASDTCSPFCSCACCGVQMLRQEFTFALLPSTPRETFEKPLSSYQSRLHSDYTGSIWQPPRSA